MSHTVLIIVGTVLLLVASILGIIFKKKLNQDSGDKKSKIGLYFARVLAVASLILAFIAFYTY